MKFELTGSELELCDKFRSKMERIEDSSTIGGRFSYVFTPNGIGMTVEILDNLLDRSLDVTDYSRW